MAIARAKSTPVEHWTAADWHRWEDEMYHEGGERIRADLRRLQARGVLDENGERVTEPLPAAMLAAAESPADIP